MADATYPPVLPTTVRVLPDDDSCPDLPIIERGGRAWAVAWPGVGSHLRSIHRISLVADGSTTALRHPMEAVYYVISGSATVHDVDLGIDYEVIAGAMILIDPGTRYRISAASDEVQIVGGPCPPDPGMYVHLTGAS